MAAQFEKKVTVNAQIFAGNKLDTKYKRYHSFVTDAQLSVMRQFPGVLDHSVLTVHEFSQRKP